MDTATYANTPKFVPPLRFVKVLRVYDGDTFWCAADIGLGQVFRWSVRLRGIDTPEIRTRNQEEKRAAHEARQALEFILRSADRVELRNVALDKYGRVLADVFVLDDVHVNGYMLREYPHLVREYHGGRRVAYSVHSRYNSPL